MAGEKHVDCFLDVPSCVILPVNNFHHLFKYTSTKLYFDCAGVRRHGRGRYLLGAVSITIETNELLVHTVRVSPN